MTGPEPVRLIRPELGEAALAIGAELRAVLGQFATGVTVLTVGGDNPHGMTANAFSSVSLAPPMALCCVAGTTRLHTAVTATGSFAVSILSADQEGTARYFADRARPSGAAQFDAVETRTGVHTGAPLIEGALAWIECSLAEVYAGGDHSIFLGDVLAFGRGTATSALSFFGGSFHRIDPQDRLSSRSTRLKEAS